MTPSPPPAVTLHATAEQIRAGAVSCVSVVERCLDAISQRESEVRAWVMVDREGALQRAAELDEELRAGRWHGPLHGIPIGIKDIINVAGWPTVAGYPPWEGRRADKDAPVVERLRRHGAILLGKTVTTQFASFDPPVTRNPWNAERTPGGSSSGSAAAVAAGMCLGSIGTQTGGSITRPASFCGGAACKPTFGRAPLDGIVPLSPRLDHVGPMAASVRDVAILLEALVTPPNVTPTQAERFADAMNRPGPGLPRIGRLGGFFRELAEPEMRDAMDHLSALCERKGTTIAEVPLPPSFDTVLQDHKELISGGSAEVHAALYRSAPGTFLPRISEQISYGLQVPAERLAGMPALQAAARREILRQMDGLDAVVCPATRGAAPERSTTGDPSFNAPWSFTGLPVVSFPIARTPDGMPLCVQVIGRPDEEASLFRVAGWIEQAVRG